MILPVSLRPGRWSTWDLNPQPSTCSSALSIELTRQRLLVFVFHWFFTVLIILVCFIPSEELALFCKAKYWALLYFTFNLTIKVLLHKDLNEMDFHYS